MITRVAVVANPHKPEAEDLARAACGQIARLGGETFLSLSFDENLADFRTDLAVVFGGDGTVLSAVRRLGDDAPPILAVNLGRLGYLAGIPPSEIESNLQLAMEGRLAATSRALLEASVDGGPWSRRALNEFVLTAAHPGRMLPIALAVDDEDVMHLRGDGIIVSSATGSTAYALSAGGPLASPELKALIVVPICPHQLVNRPIVLGPDEIVRLRHNSENQVEIASDGLGCLFLERGAELRIRMSRQTVRLLTPKRGKFQTLREKLGWGWERKP